MSSDRRVLWSVHFVSFEARHLLPKHKFSDDEVHCAGAEPRGDACEAEYLGLQT